MLRQKLLFFALFYFLLRLLVLRLITVNLGKTFFSYNNVKDFVKVANVIYALADNAVFIYDIDTQQIQKRSSIQGLSGETTTAIHFSESTNRLIIGYEKWPN